VLKSLEEIKKALPNVGAEITSPDDKTMINNIIEMLKQILGTGAEAVEPEAPVEIMEEMADTSDELDVEKEKSVDSKIGDEGVDTRLEDQTPITDNAMSKIGKSLEDIKKLLAGKTVRKAQTAPAQGNNAVVMKSLQAIAGVMKELADRQKTQETFMSGLMNNIGISDEIVQKALTTPEITTPPAGRPDQKTDMINLMTEFMKSMNNKQNDQTNEWGGNPLNDPWARKGDVRKNLDPVLDHLFNK